MILQVDETDVKHATFVPHNVGRYQLKRFKKAQYPIIERLTNSKMMRKCNNGKKLTENRIYNVPRSRGYNTR